MIHPAWLLGLAALTQAPAPRIEVDASAPLRAARESIRRAEVSRFEALADRLARDGRTAEAAEVRARIEPAPPKDGPSRIMPLPEVVPAGTGGLANVPAGANPTAPWRKEFQAIRSEAARALFALAGEAAKSARYSLADDALRAVLDRQPDHPEARRLLGFVPYKGGWATPYAVSKLKAGEVQHAVFGWVPADWVPHLDKGELPAPRERKGDPIRWLPAAEADALRAHWSRPWQITTEHFDIHTDVPMSEAITFARRLEAFHQLFYSLMGDVFGRELPLAQRLSNPKLEAKLLPSPRYHRVFYFATKDEYVQHLEPVQGPAIAKTLGFYLTPKEARQLKIPPTSYFFRDVGGQLDVTATLYHEVSHQLLFESSVKGEFEKNTGNFWVFEGLGTYFETVEPQPDGSLLVGGLVGPRIEQARIRLIEKGQFVPTALLVAMGKARFTGDDGVGDVYLHYAEAMALTAFLMQYDGHRYREGFLDYVEDAYRGRFRGRMGRSLEDRLGTPYATLDEQFLAFLKAGARPAKPD